MKKRITPDQLKKGEVTYTFDAFLKKLWEDVKVTLAEEHPEKILKKKSQSGNYEQTLKDVFVFVYRICYLAAMKNPELKRLLESADSKNREVVKMTLKSNEGNIALLRAIFVKEISEKLGKGLTKRQAVKATIEKSKSAFASWKE